ncbi:uncharacterized protein BKCO1_7300013 [Diplodia corticola]|uniref:Uncharacterized protein n=1 Tax=Diplodia corticola TaxID=236234 RepID=A0A1J9RBD1_9PEZI|nr:uncharacterized protein BKCO1_7300013 [Diplodia corticola]OJD29739.1 hypothetical protein BKCO1_7300013 [Diplodia corticola]
MNFTTPFLSTSVPTKPSTSSPISPATLSVLNSTASASSINHAPDPGTLVTELSNISILQSPSTPRPPYASAMEFTTETTTTTLSPSGPTMPNTTTLFVTMTDLQTSTGTTTIFRTVTIPLPHPSSQGLTLSRLVDTSTKRRPTTVTITKFPTSTIHTTMTVTWFPPPSTTTITELTTQAQKTRSAPAPAPTVTSSLPGVLSSMPATTSLQQDTSLSISSTSSPSSYYLTVDFPSASMPDSPATTTYPPSSHSRPTHTNQPTHSAVGGAGNGSVGNEKSITTIVGTVCGAVTFVLALFAVGAWWRNRKTEKKAKTKRSRPMTAVSARRTPTTASWMSSGLERGRGLEGGGRTYATAMED